MSQMNKLSILLSIFILCGTAEASWYWPFGGKSEAPKLRVSELMEPVSETIDEASDLASEGKLAEAVEKYREALFKIDRIEVENADRAKSAAFATIRNKRAYVNAAIDSLLLRQAQQSARAVAVTDTTELEKKYEAMKRAAKERAALAKEQEAKARKEQEERAKKELEEKAKEAERARAAEKAKEQEKAKEAEKPAEPEKVAEPEPAEKPEAPAKPEPPPATAVQPPALAAPAEQPEDAALAQSSRRARLLLVSADIKCGNYNAALASIERLLAERPNDPAALNLRAAVETEKGEYEKAEQTLDLSIRNHPKSHFAYYNMARLILKTRGERGKEAARGYYEAGRVRGGPVDKSLEAAL